MSNARDRAEKAKALGNTAFKEGNYLSAIGHYTTAILADPKDKTFPLNRAATYLKLGKNQDAERDCSTVLGLDSGNVKALFRRAQARTALENLTDARKDLERALQLEPANQSVKQELETTIALIQKQSTKPTRAPADIKPKPFRRRVPIKIVDASEPTPPATDLLTPVSSRPIESASQRSVPASQPLPQSTFQEAKQARSAKVGGGIFRSSGSHTVFKPPTPTPPVVPKEPVAAAAPRSPVIAKEPNPLSTPPAKPPISLFSFTKTWESLDTPEEKWAFLQETLSPQSLPAFFQTSLEPPLLTSILSTFLSTLKSSTATFLVIKAYMISLSQVARFSTMLMFMSNEEQAVVGEIWTMLGTQSNDTPDEDAKNRRAWGV